MLLSLPSDLLTNLCSEWLNLKTLGFLDCSLTNNEHRRQVLPLLSAQCCVCNGEIGGTTKNNDVYRWVNKRNLQVKSAVVRITKATKITEKTNLLNQLKFLETLEVVRGDRYDDTVQNIRDFMQYLPSPEKLTSLKFNGISNEGLDATLYGMVSRYPNIASLTIKGSGEDPPEDCTDYVEVWFEGLTSLALDTVSDANLIFWLIASEHLETVSFKFCQLDGEIMQKVSLCPKITSLTVIDPQGVDMVDELRQLMKKLPVLASLTLHLDYEYSEILLAAVASCPLLCDVSLYGGLGTASLESFQSIVALPSLQSLALSGHFQADKFVRCLSASKSLSVLSFEDSFALLSAESRKVSDEALTEVLQHCSSLQHIDAGLLIFGPKLLESIATHGIAMKSVKLKASKIQPKDLHVLEAGCPRLQCVKLGGMTKESKKHWDAAFAAVQAKRPSLEFIITHFNW